MPPPRGPTRLSSFHTPKRQLLGHPAAQPAWRPPPGVLPHQLPGQGGGHVTPNSNGIAGGKGKAPAGADPNLGSKIFLSRLPIDVGEKEVEELFRKTIGPLKESFLVYNSQGRSKGMAVVHFQRAGDAAAAKAKYDGKIVDRRKPIKIEIVSDSISTSSLAPTAAPAQPQPTSLLHRLGVSPSVIPKHKPPPTGPSARGKRPAINVTPRFPPSAPVQQKQQQPIVADAPRHPRRVKKGPKRLKKVVARHAADVVVAVNRKQLTVDDLDKEMEDYRAAAPGAE